MGCRDAVYAGGLRRGEQAHGLRSDRMRYRSPDRHGDDPDAVLFVTFSRIRIEPMNGMVDLSIADFPVTRF